MRDIFNDALGVLGTWITLLFIDGACSIVIFGAWSILAYSTGLPKLGFIDIWMGLFIVDFTIRVLK